MSPPASDLGELVFLGTGTSHGVPTIGCTCSVCHSPDPRDQRTRCSVLLGLPAGNLLIDTTPELRIQLVREGIGLVHAVFYTHAHADHLFGLDDCRIFADYLGTDLPVYCEPEVERVIRRAFAYAFDPVAQQYPAGGVPRLDLRPLEPMISLDLLGVQIEPVRLLHGYQGVLGFRVGDLAYCTDVKTIPPESASRLQGLDTLVLDCLREEPHISHMGLDEALAAVEQLRPRRALFTHISHRLEHESTNRRLPAGVELAYDGLRIPIRGMAKAKE